MEEWGQWDENIIENQIREYTTTGQVDVSLVSPLPSTSRRSRNDANSSRRESTCSVQQEPPHEDNPQEEPLADIDMVEMIEAFYEQSDGNEDDSEEEHNDPTISRLRELASTPLCDGSRASVLRTCLAMLNLQSIYGWSDASVTSLFKLLKTSILPIVNRMPETRDGAKKLLADIGMDYNSIHACPNDCILYRKEYADLDVCPKCQHSRYR